MLREDQVTSVEAGRNNAVIDGRYDELVEFLTTPLQGPGDRACYALSSTISSEYRKDVL